MPYPIINKNEARAYYLSIEAALEPMPVPEPQIVHEGIEEDWDAIGETAAAMLLSLIDAQKGPAGPLNGAKFEAAAGPELHQILPSDHPAMGNPEFWIWLTATHCQEVVDLRYAGKKRSLKNFGIGGSGENLLYRLWLRAEIARGASSQGDYKLASCGDIDFWRSHIFRQRYGEVRSFTHALLQFQFPAEKGGKPRLKIDEIRDLAKHLKRARSNLLYEVMSEARAILFIESEWGKLASQSS